MKRRAFFASLAMAAVAVRRAFADASITAPARAAARDATTRPTLVFVVPRDEARRRQRGDALREFLQHAGDAELAPLAAVEVVCEPYGSAEELVMLLRERGGRRVRGVVDAPDAPLTRAVIAQLLRKVLPTPGKSAATLAAEARRRYVIEVSRRYLDSDVKVP